MNDRQLDRRVEQAFERVTPDLFDSILADCGHSQGRVTALKGTKRRAWKKQLAGIAAALALLICGGAGFYGYQAANTPTAVVSLDVNPSVEIIVNRNEKVIRVNPVNQDGETIIGDMDFSGSSLEVTVNALIGSMLRNGYLSDLANSILVSVDSTDAAEARELREKLSREIDQLLQTGSFSGAVLSQVVSHDEELEALAAEHGISLGKAQLIRRIAGDGSKYSFEELAGLNINDLNLILSASSQLPEGLSLSGSASSKGYLSPDEAIRKAMAYAELVQEDIAGATAELELEAGKMIYEVELLCGGFEYDYILNAATGETLACFKEYADDLETIAEAHAEEWEAWAEQHADELEAWAREYAGDWEAWAKDHAAELEAWAKEYAGSWEAWAGRLESWADRYFDF